MNRAAKRPDPAGSGEFDGGGPLPHKLWRLRPCVRYADGYCLSSGAANFSVNGLRAAWAPVLRKGAGTIEECFRLLVLGGWPCKPWRRALVTTYACSAPQGRPADDHKPGGKLFRPNLHEDERLRRRPASAGGGADGAYGRHCDLRATDCEEVPEDGFCEMKGCQRPTWTLFCPSWLKNQHCCESCMVTRGMHDSVECPGSM